ncbi:hypothetical protein IIA29_07220 [candidate division KSB1 bacterium]|nr:hypothetical protein [candidate division KSB1 bacterium]
METKLTLRLDERIINAAKVYAQERGISLSKLVANYFQYLTSQNKSVHAKTPILTEITGILKDVNEARDLEGDYKRHLEEKYL